MTSFNARIEWPLKLGDEASRRACVAVAIEGFDATADNDDPADDTDEVSRGDCVAGPKLPIEGFDRTTDIDESGGIFFNMLIFSFSFSINSNNFSARCFSLEV